MSVARYVHWQDQGMWLGYSEEFPDCLTQGETLEELQENLRDLYKDLTGGEIAEALGADTVYSEDLNHAPRYGRVRVVNPFA